MTIYHHRFLVAGLGTAAALAVGCGDGKKKTVSVDQPAETSGDPANPGSLNGLPQGVQPNPVPPGAALLQSTFNLDAKSIGIQMCKGEVTVKLNANIDKQASAQLFEIPVGKINCGLFGNIDLAQVLGSMSQAGQGQAQPQVSVEGDVIHLSAIGTGTYTPPRPLLPSFLAASRERLRTLNYTKQVTVTSATEGRQAAGNVNVQTLEFAGSHKPPMMRRTFKDVIYFKVTNTGFDGVNKVGNALFDEMTFRISLKPLAILQFTFKGKVADYAAAMPAGGGGAGGLGGLLGGGGGGGLGGGGILGMIVGLATKLIDVNVTADLVKQDGLVDDPNAVDSGETGEVIGGVPGGAGTP